MQHRITVKETGAEFLCGSDQAVLNAMLHSRAGPIGYGCCGGGCGVCKVHIVEGQWEAFKNMSRAHVSEEEEKKGIVLLCCVQPRSNLTVSQQS